MKSNPNVDLALETYEARLKWLRDETSALETRYLRGKAEGRAEGIAEGLALGEEKAKLDVARTMDQQGLDRNSIRAITGLEAW